MFLPTRSSLPVPAASARHAGGLLAAALILVLVALAGPAASVASADDGALVGWGKRIDLGATLPGGTLIAKTPLSLGGSSAVPTAAAVTAGRSLVLTSEGVYTVGNGGGASGLGTGVPAANLTLIPGTDDVTAVSAGEDAALLLRRDGTVWAWGVNLYGAVGGSGVADAPRKVEGISDVAAIASTRHTSLALKSDGSVWAWGRSYTLGSAAAVAAGNSASPVRVALPVGRTATKITGGLEHALAVLDDGSVAAWGRNNTRQIGNDSTTDVAEPIVVLPSSALPSGVTVSGITAGSGTSFALLSDGTYRAWGRSGGFLGLGNGGVIAGTPTAPAATVPNSPPFVELVANSLTAVARTADGRVYAWGQNGSGLLGGDAVTFAHPYPYTGDPLAPGTVGQTVTEIPQRIPKLLGVPWLAVGPSGAQQVTLSQQTLAPIATSLAFFTQPRGTTSATKTITFSSRLDPSTVTRARIIGAAAEDFSIVGYDAASDVTFPYAVAANGSITVRLRFTPTELAERQATLVLETAGESASVALEGYGVELPGNVVGAPGADGTNGVNGTNGIHGTNGTNGTNGVIVFAASRSTVTVKRGRTVKVPFLLANGTGETLARTTLKARVPGALRARGSKVTAVAAIRSGASRTVRVVVRTGKAARVGVHVVRVQLRIGATSVSRTVKLRVTR